MKSVKVKKYKKRKPSLIEIWEKPVPEKQRRLFWLKERKDASIKLRQETHKPMAEWNLPEIRFLEIKLRRANRELGYKW